MLSRRVQQIIRRGSTGQDAIVKCSLLAFFFKESAGDCAISLNIEVKENTTSKGKEKNIQSNKGLYSVR